MNTDYKKIENHKITENSTLFVYRNFLSDKQGFSLLEYYKNNLIWTQDEYTFGDKTIKSPRLISLQGNKDYFYSGRNHIAHPLDKYTLRFLNKINNLFSVNNNGVLFNYYRNGLDSISLHSDDETDMDENSSIISLSLGETRTFVVKPLKNKKQRFLLNNGDLALMLGKFQKECKHEIPKEPEKTKERINLTFRNFK